MLEFGNDEGLCQRTAPYVLNINDDEENVLKVLVSLPVIGEPKAEPRDTGLDVLDEVLANARPICPDEEQIYEITFGQYIMYQVRNESFSSWDDYEIRNGKYFIVFQRSRLLDYLQTVTDCQQMQDGSFWPGRWKHYGIYSQNHIVDIIAYQEPVIKKRD